MAELRTEQLECMLKCVIPSSRTVVVLGVFPADRVPLEVITDVNGVCTLRSRVNDTTLPTNVNYCFILNTDPYGQPGMHWLGFFYNCSTNTLEYFDSFGMPLASYAAVHAALDICNLSVVCIAVNVRGMLQSVVSTVCGQYCVVFLYWRVRHSTCPQSQFTLSLATLPTCTQRDKYIVHQLRMLLIRAGCCGGTLPRSACSQTCTCSHI